MLMKKNQPNANQKTTETASHGLMARTNAAPSMMKGKPGRKAGSKVDPRTGRVIPPNESPTIQAARQNGDLPKKSGLMVRTTRGPAETSSQGVKWPTLESVLAANGIKELSQVEGSTLPQVVTPRNVKGILWNAFGLSWYSNEEASGLVEEARKLAGIKNAKDVSKDDNIRLSEEWGREISAALAIPFQMK